MSSDPASCLLSSPSRENLPPSSPCTTPLRPQKRPLQDAQDSPRRYPPPKFTDYPISSEPSKNYSTFEPDLQVSSPASRRSLRRSFHLAQLKRSSLHIEKRLVSQKILEHEITLQALRERMLDIETNITSTARVVGNLHCHMDQVGVPIPDMAESVASSIMFFENVDIPGEDLTYYSEEDATSGEDEVAH